MILISSALILASSFKKLKLTSRAETLSGVWRRVPFRKTAGGAETDMFRWFEWTGLETSPSEGQLRWFGHVDILDKNIEHGGREEERRERGGGGHVGGTDGDRCGHK